MRADRALYLPGPGEEPRILGDIADIIRSSAERFVQGISSSLTPWPSDLFGFVNAFSSMTYERAGAEANW